MKFSRERDLARNFLILQYALNRAIPCRAADNIDERTGSRHHEEVSLRKQRTRKEADGQEKRQTDKKRDRRTDTLKRCHGVCAFILFLACCFSELTSP